MKKMFKVEYWYPFFWSVDVSSLLNPPFVENWVIKFKYLFKNRWFYKFVLILFGYQHCRENWCLLVGWYNRQMPFGSPRVSINIIRLFTSFIFKTMINVFERFPLSKVDLLVDISWFLQQTILYRLLNLYI